MNRYESPGQILRGIKMERDEVLPTLALGSCPCREHCTTCVRLSVRLAASVALSGIPRSLWEPSHSEFSSPAARTGPLSATGIHFLTFRFSFSIPSPLSMFGKYRQATSPTTRPLIPPLPADLLYTAMRGRTTGREWLGFCGQLMNL